MTRRHAPSASHTAEPFDGSERDMHKCSDCARRLGCLKRIPIITQPVRCESFKPKGNR